jgi:hypothetical protein
MAAQPKATLGGSVSASAASAPADTVRAVATDKDGVSRETKAGPDGAAQGAAETRGSEEPAGVAEAVKLVEAEFNKAHGGGWRVSALQQCPRMDGATLRLELVLCNGEQCRIATANVDPAAHTVRFAAKKGPW